jgi:radical SAM superfamily enzyme YgiQ (UPF0313 family)
MNLVPAKKRIWLVQQGVWDTPVESMPLAMGYLKAVALSDEIIRNEVDIRIFSFRGGESTTTMARALYYDERPDIVAFSVFGWNFQPFGTLAEAFRHINPDGWVIFGGTHVAHQGKRVFGVFPQVDVVANGEGEFIFRDLLHAYLAGKSRHDLGSVEGISFKSPDGEVTTTADRKRIDDLDVIPSPFLTKAISLHNAEGRLQYELVLMETNRGCPYKCSFCYWGGAIGQKVRSFSRDRLREELDMIGFHKYPHLILCDANVGMLAADQEFIEDLIAVRERYGFPRQLDCSWAKNKSKVFYNIVRRMKQTGFRTSFTIALQTLNDDALESMHRKNMKLNEWENLVSWINKQGLDCYAELIWGAPGDTPETFLEGYDRVARRVSCITTYPMLLLPNTEYANNRKKYGINTIRHVTYDFEYVLSHQTMSIQDNERINNFLFWARVFAEYRVFMPVWSPLRELADITQSQVLLSLASWFNRQDDPLANEITKCQPKGCDLVADTQLARATRALHSSPQTTGLLDRWWREEMLPRVPAHLADFFNELFRYEQHTRPIFADAKEAKELNVVQVNGESYLVREDVPFAYDIPRIIEKCRIQEPCEIIRRPTRISLYYKVGFGHNPDSHEFVLHYRGKTQEKLFPPSVIASEEAVKPS